MSDRFFGQAPGFDALAATEAYVITPADAVVLSRIPRGIIAETTGRVRMTLQRGDVAVFFPVVAGTLYPVRPKIIHSTGTTSTTLLGIE